MAKIKEIRYLIALFVFITVNNCNILSYPADSKRNGNKRRDDSLSLPILLFPMESDLDECRITGSELKGTCTPITQCSQECYQGLEKEVRKSICFWKGIEPVVCCPCHPPETNGEDHDVDRTHGERDEPGVSQKPCSDNPECITDISGKETNDSLPYDPEFIVEPGEDHPLGSGKCGIRQDPPDKNDTESEELLEPDIGSLIDRRKILLSSRPSETTESKDVSAPTDVTIPGYNPNTRYETVGGVIADENSWPWMAAIFRNQSRSPFCGGFLINTRYVISAAHCFLNSRLEPADYTVVLSRTNVAIIDSRSMIRVLDIKLHEHFDRILYYNDIAILHIRIEELPGLTPDPVCFPSKRLSNSDVLLGKNATVLGWGDLFFGGPDTTRLQQVDGIPIVSTSECNSRYSGTPRSPQGNTEDLPPLDRITEEHFICAGLPEGGKDACSGDSGGPLMIKEDGQWVVVGIVSFGRACALPGVPGVYTRISSYRDWILDAIKNPDKW